MSVSPPRPVRPVSRVPDLRLQAVPSKSHAARALVAASLAPGDSLLENLPEAGDTRVLVEGLGLLGARLRPVDDGALRVRGLEPPLSAGTRRVDRDDGMGRPSRNSLLSRGSGAA